MNSKSSIFDSILNTIESEDIRKFAERCIEKQIIISTHSSFIANKLGLENLILLENDNYIRISYATSENIIEGAITRLINLSKEVI